MLLKKSMLSLDFSSNPFLAGAELVAVVPKSCNEIL